MQQYFSKNENAVHHLISCVFWYGKECIFIFRLFAAKT